MVVEVPASVADFEAVVGVAPGSYGQVAAATVAGGPTADAAVHVVVNPTAERRLSDSGLGVVLTHESVHAATRSPTSLGADLGGRGSGGLRRAPGLPGRAGRCLRALAGGGAQHGRSRRLYPPTTTSPPMPRSWPWRMRARGPSRSSSPRRTASTRLGRLYTALDTGTSLQEAARPTLGVSERELLAAWRRDLSRRAGRVT